MKLKSLILLAGGLGYCASSSIAQTLSPFPCSDKVYLCSPSKNVKNASSNVDSGTVRISSLNMKTGLLDTFIYTGFYDYFLQPLNTDVTRDTSNISNMNAIGFNPKDRFIYGTVGTDISPYYLNGTLNPLYTPVAIKNHSTSGIVDSTHLYKFGTGGGKNWARIPVDFPASLGVSGFQFGLAGTFDKDAYYFNIRYSGGAANSPGNSGTGWKHHYLL